MADKIVQGCITNMDTGETYSGEHYLFCPGSEMTTIVKILKTQNFVHPDESMQVSVDCLGLDSVGNVFELGMEYTPESIEQRDKLIQDLTTDSIYLVKGIYGTGEYGTPDSFIAIYDAMYRPVEPDFSEDQVREVFRVNGKKWENKLP